MALRPVDPIFNNPGIGSYPVASIDFMADIPLLENFKRATLDSGLYVSTREKQLLQSSEFWESEYVAEFIARNQHQMGFRPREQEPSPTWAEVAESDPSWFTEKMKRCSDEELEEEGEYEPWYSGSTHDHQQSWPPIQSVPDFTEFLRLPTPPHTVPPSYAAFVGNPAPHDPVFAFGSSGEYCSSSDRPAIHPTIGSYTGGNVAPVAPVAPMCVAGPPSHYGPFSMRSDIAPVAPPRTANGLVYAFGSSGEHSSSHGVTPPRPAGSSYASCSRSKSGRFSAQTQPYCAPKHCVAPSAPAVPMVNPYTDYPDNFVPSEPARTVQPYVNHHTNNAPQLGREVSPANSYHSTNTTPRPQSSQNSRHGTNPTFTNNAPQLGREVSPADSFHSRNTTPRPQSSQNSSPGTNPTFTNNPRIQYPVSQAHPAPISKYERWIWEVTAMAQPEIPAQDVIIAAQQMVRAQQDLFAQQEVYTQQEVPVKLVVPELPKPRRGRPPGTGGKYKQRAKKGGISTVKRAKRPVAVSSK